MRGGKQSSLTNKKRKAKNSFLYNGQESQRVKKMKRTAYFVKADRLDAKRELKKAVN